MPPPLLYDISQFDFDHPLVAIEGIREVNPQRGAMEQLTGIVHLDRERHGVVGFKDITHDEFWTAGHMPGFPLMPGVVMCECVAQLAGYYARRFRILGGDFIGFGGMDEVRFRAPVFPGCRLILLVQCMKIRPGRQATFQFQGVVGDRTVLTGEMIGVPITKAETSAGDANPERGS